MARGDLQDNLAAYWQLEEASGSRADSHTGGMSGAYMNGLIDEVGVWRVALGSVAISDLYNSGTGLVWPLRDGPPTFRRTRGLR